MKRTLSGILFAVLIIASLSASAQKTITFEARPKKSESKHKLGEGKNSITMGLGSFFGGYTPIYYERAIINFLTLSVGAGVTHRSYFNDLGLAIWDEGQNSEDFSSSEDIADNYASYKFRVCKPGAYFSLAPKIYPRSAALDGGYFGPMIEYKQFLYNVRVADLQQRPNGSYGDEDSDIPRAGNTLQESMTCLDLTMNCGGHFQLKNHLAIGWSFGFGVRRRTSDRLDLGIRYDAGNNPYYVNNLRSYTTSKPILAFNFTVGGWF
jgi:hypothetical protein